MERVGVHGVRGTSGAEVGIIQYGRAGKWDRLGKQCHCSGLSRGQTVGSSSTAWSPGTASGYELGGSDSAGLMWGGQGYGTHYGGP